MTYLRFCFSLLFFCCLLCPVGAQAAERHLDAAPAMYSNDRYGFSLSWPAGKYTLKEADNGDLTVRDAYGMVMNIYGTFGYHVLDQSFDDALADLSGRFDSITYKKADKKAGWFVLSGYRDDAVGYLKCLFTADRACIVDIAYPKARKTEYEALIKAVSQSFKLGRP